MLSLILNAWCAVIFLMFFAWIVSYYLNNPAVIDVFWPIAITLAGFIFLHDTITEPPPLMFGLLLLIWCLRLAIYLLVTRIVPGHLDKRYESLSKHWKIKSHWGFLINFQFQGILATLIALPFLFTSQASSLDLSTYFALLLVLIGLIGEILADSQLQRFRRIFPGKVCNQGLWKYSRHPNYFFELLIWLGFAIAPLPSSWTWLSLVSPLLLLVIMLVITAPITEQCSLQSKGDAYRKYQKKTSVLFPWPPKKEDD